MKTHPLTQWYIRDDDALNLVIRSKSHHANVKLQGVLILTVVEIKTLSSMLISFPTKDSYML